MTHLSVDVIRAWERRYKIVEPQRDEAGLRLYTDDDVARLALVRAATKLGHPVRRVAQMSNEQLKSLADQPALDGKNAEDVVVERVLAALRDNDARLAAQTLASAALLLPTRQLVLNVLAPLLREVGRQWEHGYIAVWQEHLISTLIRNIAAGMPRSGDGGAPMLFATPPFEPHEFGIALAAILAASSGRTTDNLGTGVPHEEIAKAARRLKPAVVVIGMTQHLISNLSALEYAAALNAELAPVVEIWLGGTLGAEIAPQIESKRVHAVATLEDFERICLS